ncbi:MAG: N-methylhydantoinase, partial [Mycobacterium sp.]|nr:N-methylhydantoinase [Mycobacterium sp.]
GDRLTFSNEGSDPQCYAASACFSAWRSALVCAGSTMLAYDQLYCPAGVADHMEFEPTPGTLLTATYPAALTPVTTAIVSLYLASQVIGKMVMAGPEEIRRVANATGGVSLPGYWVASGLDRRGNPVATLTGDVLCGSIGAFPHRDGVDTGGAWWMPNSTSGNVEEWEATLPILYLYRREQVDSGGAGRWRGGNGAETAIVPHKTDALNMQIVACDPAINTSPGLAGGLPGHPGNYLLAEKTDVQRLLSGGTMPRDRADLEERVGPLTRLSPKDNRVIGRSDVFTAEYSGGGAFGDPLLREPRLVAQDREQRRISVEAVGEKYGVVLGVDGTADLHATEVERETLRKERLAMAHPPRNAGGVTVEKKTVRTVGDALGVTFAGDPRGEWACIECGCILGSAAGNYKHGAATVELNPYEVDRVAYPDPREFCGVPFVMRVSICPGCGTILSTECCRADAEPSADIQLFPDGLRLLAHRTI